MGWLPAPVLAELAEARSITWAPDSDRPLAHASGRNRHSLPEWAAGSASPATDGGFVPGAGLWTTCHHRRRHPQVPGKADANSMRLPIVTDVIELDELLAAHSGILLAREHRRRKSSLSRWCRAGRLVRLLPGVYVHPAARDDLRTRLRALAAKVPDAVIAGDAAARLTAWREVQVGVIEVCTASRRVQKPGYRFVRRRVPPESTRYRGGLSFLSEALVAVDAAVVDRGDRIDDLLRLRHPLAEVEAALAACPGRRGNRVRRRVVRRSRTNPWSQAERLLHDILDRNRLRGWTANHPVTACGSDYWLDVAFRSRQVALEVDGYEHHSSRQAFEADRHRHNDLVAEDWTVLHVTWAMLTDEARLMARIRAAVHRRKGGRSPRAG